MHALTERISLQSYILKLQSNPLRWSSNDVYLLGLAHLAGIGVSLDISLGCDLVKKAVTLKHPAAMFFTAATALGLYTCPWTEDAQGGDPLLLLQASYKLEANVATCLALGWCFMFGVKTSKNQDIAQIWFLRALQRQKLPRRPNCMEASVRASANFLLAAQFLLDLEKEQQPGKQSNRKKKHKREERKQKAARLLRFAADFGHVGASYVLAHHPLLAKDGSLNLDSWLEEHQMTVFQTRLLDVVQDAVIKCQIPLLKLSDETAALVDQVDAERGNYWASHCLGVSSLYGRAQALKQPVPMMNNGIQWLHFAANQGDFSEAQWMLGMCYLEGYGVIQSETKAVFWLTKAARNGHKNACYDLGKRLLLSNKRENVAKGRYWIQQAASLGHGGALHMEFFFASGKGKGKGKDKDEENQGISLLPTVKPPKETLSAPSNKGKDKKQMTLKPFSMEKKTSDYLAFLMSPTKHDLF